MQFFYLSSLSSPPSQTRLGEFLLLSLIIILLCTDYLLRTGYPMRWGFPGGSEGKESACNARYRGSIPGSGRSPEQGNVYPLQYSCLENPMDRGTWQAIVHRVAKSRTELKRLGRHKLTFQVQDSCTCFRKQHIFVC